MLAAAVVLGFLIVGLTRLQLGNREAIFRIRTRDAANFVAQHVLDSLASIGISSLVADGDKKLVFAKDDYVYRFEGKDVKSEIKFGIEVEFLDKDGNLSIDTTAFTKANRKNSGGYDEEEVNRYAKSLKAKVSWKHRDSEQSIEMAKVVR